MSNGHTTLGVQVDLEGLEDFIDELEAAAEASPLGGVCLSAEETSMVISDLRALAALWSEGDEEEEPESGA